MASFMSRVIRCPTKNRSVWIITATLAIAILVLYQGAGYRNDPQGTRQNTEVTRSHTYNQTKPHLVFGILSADGNRDFRDAQRNTWIADAISLKEDIPFKFTYKFVLDLPTANTSEENKTHGDIVYLNVTNHGYPFKFGEKIYSWLRYMFLNFPDAYMGVRMDDDVFLCVPQIFKRLDIVKSSKLYYGWTNNKKAKTVSKTATNDDMFIVDDMFAVVGSELIERIAKREYCYDNKRCNETTQLVDRNWGATSLSTWLAIYDDVDFKNDNSRIIFSFGKDKQKRDKFAHYIEPSFCDRYILFHKSTPEQMRQLHIYNSKNNTKVLPSATTGSLFSGMIIRDTPSKATYTGNVGTVRKDDMKHCDNWAVVTTIFPQSDAVKIVANDIKWCLVIVADTKTPEQGIYLKGIASDRVKFLSVKEQYNMYPLLADSVPVNSFARKNIGYIYAIHHGAVAIWDFDDDNINVIDLNDFNSSTKYVTICQDFKSNVANPYPYFAAPNRRIWPRGFPLQYIKEATYIPKVCKLKENVSIGIIQSLANVEPDVDAIYRLTNDMPYNFTAKKGTHAPLVLTDTVYAPFNGQATLWLSPTFKYMALPVSVHGRVSDIWRAYVAQHFMHKDGVRLAFSRPYVTQIRNSHENINDFNAELDLYQKSRQLVDFLSSEDARYIQNTMAMYEQLYRRGFLELNDLKFIDAWTKTFQAVTVDQRE